MEASPISLFKKNANPLGANVDVENDYFSIDSMPQEVMMRLKSKTSSIQR